MTLRLKHGILLAFSVLVFMLIVLFLAKCVAWPDLHLGGSCHQTGIAADTPELAYPSNGTAAIAEVNISKEAKARLRGMAKTG